MLKNVKKYIFSRNIYFIKWLYFYYQKLFSKKIKMLNTYESIQYLIDSGKSLSRFGDGELLCINGGNPGFQDGNEQLGEKLKYVLTHPIDNCCIGIPDAINHITNLEKDTKKYWINYMCSKRIEWLNFLDTDYTYLCAQITRPYIRYKNKKKCSFYFNMLKKIWNGKDIVIVEGDKTRMGVGNDLFNNVTKIERILCPACNAFEKYDDILQEVKKISKTKLILIALGPTATVLAYDLALSGYRALDIGHMDIEYEWFLRNVDKRIDIENKSVNEVYNGNIVNDINDKNYYEQIICRINN